MEILPIIGGILTLLGAVNLLLGAIGIVRMPDFYNRVHAGTKATTLGTLFFLLGAGFYHPSWIPKLFILSLFILFTNPVSSHVLARAAHSIGIKLTKVTVVDKLIEPEGEEIDA